MDNVQKETLVVSVMNHEPLETKAERARDEKDDRLLPHLIRGQIRLTARDKKSQRDLAIKRKAPSTKGVHFHADTDSVQIRHVSSGILPCVRTKGLKKGCICGDKRHFRHVEAEGKPNKKSKK